MRYSMRLTFLLLMLLILRAPTILFGQSGPCFDPWGTFETDPPISNPAYHTSISMVHSETIGGTLVAIGAPVDNSPVGSRHGVVYIYKSPVDDHGQWTLEHVLSLPANLSQAECRFGHSVAFAGENVIVIGSPRYDKTGRGGHEDCGAVHVFEYFQADQKWYHHETIIPDDLNAGDNFGHAVSARWYDDDTTVNKLPFVVGAPNADKDGATSGANWDCGSVYVYNWIVDPPPLTPEYELMFHTFCPNPTGRNRFGSSVSCNRDQHEEVCFAVGAPVEHVDVGSTRYWLAGAAYHYRPDPVDVFAGQRIVSSCPQSGARFGSAVAISQPNIYHSGLNPPVGQVLVVGAPYHDTSSEVTDDGIAEVFLPDDPSDILYEMVFQVKLQSTEADIDHISHAHFGYSVATARYFDQTIPEDREPHTILVGAPGRSRFFMGQWEENVGVIEHFDDSITPKVFTPKCGLIEDLIYATEDTRFGAAISMYRDDITWGTIGTNYAPVINFNTFMYFKSPDL